MLPMQDIKELCDNYLSFLKDKGFIFYKSSDSDRLVIGKKDTSTFNIKEIEEDLIPFLELLEKLDILFYKRIYFSNFSCKDEYGLTVKGLSISEIEGLDDTAVCSEILIAITNYK